MTAPARITASPAQIEAPRLPHYRRVMANTGAHRADRIEACDELLRYSPCQADRAAANRVLRFLCGPAVFHRSRGNG
jgi:hypothetical protein